MEFAKLQEECSTLPSKIYFDGIARIKETGIEEEVEKRAPGAVLVGIQISAATVANSMKGPQKK